MSEKKAKIERQAAKKYFDFQVSCFENIADTDGTKKKIIQQFFNEIKSGKHKTKIELVRNAPSKVLKSDLKKGLFNITISGQFTKRSDNYLVMPSGLIQVDFDLDKNPGINPIDVRNLLAKDIYTAATFISPSGTGVKLVVKYLPKSHKYIYPWLEKYYIEKHGLYLDKSCSNISRALFTSYDPEIYQNEESEIFTLPDSARDTKEEYVNPSPTGSLKEKVVPNTFNDKTRQVEILIDKIEAGGTDITGDYKQWLNIGFALASEFGLPGEDYYHRLSRFSNSYKFDECKNQFKECCKQRKSGIRINTLFAIAKQCNVFVHEIVQKSKKSDQNPSSEILFCNPVYKTDDDGNQVIKDLKINYVKFIELIYSFGFRRFDIDKDFIYIQLNDTVIKEVTVLQIQDYFFKYLENLPDVLSNGITKKALKEKLYGNPKNYFCDNRLSLLINKTEINFNVDSKSECFIYYQNGYVKCDKNGWCFYKYDTLTGHIWQSQIIKRDFKYLNLENLDISDLSVYAKFMFNVCAKDKKRFDSLCSLVGYLLHGYTDIKMKAVILTDSRISEEANGRTGKTLFGHTLKYIKKISQINGKDFDPTNRYKYQEASLDTQIIFLNDIRSNFKLEVLYNDITECITVEKKNQNPFTLKIKMVITTNKTISIEGSSSKDRCIEFEFCSHYNEKFSPEDEFKQRFFSDWDVNAWHQFDNFMMWCICIYLGNGIIEPNNVNLQKRKLLDQTNKYFLEFMQDKIATGHIVAEKEICKHELHSMFLDEYQEIREHKFKKELATFTRWIKVYAKYSEYFGDDLIERKSGNKRYFEFTRPGV